MVGISIVLVATGRIEKRKVRRKQDDSAWAYKQGKSAQYEQDNSACVYKQGKKEEYHSACGYK